MSDSEHPPGIVPPTDQPSTSKSELLMFLSVDVVGSTAYKYRYQNQKEGTKDAQPWFETFRRFYETFQEEIRFENITDYPELTKWKSLGDELLFFAPITKPQDAVILLRAFDKAIVSYRSNQKFSSEKLSLKGTAWLAGFPTINVRLTEPTDFIGPSIDAGFRISKFSTVSRLCISIELAYLVFDFLRPESMLPKDGCDNELNALSGRIWFHGLEPLVRSELGRGLQETAKANGPNNPGGSGWYDWVRINVIDWGCNCPSNAANGPYLLENFPPYDHPNCSCVCRQRMKDGNDFRRELEAWVNGEPNADLDRWYVEKYLPGQV